MKKSSLLYDNYLRPLLKYLEQQGLISTWMKSQIRAVNSRKADANHKKSARSFCFVIIGEHVIYCASALTDLPDEYLVGILLHEVAHMIIEEDGGDPELGVDEWILENVPEAKYQYADLHYADKRRKSNNLERVSEKFLREIGI